MGTAKKGLLGVNNMALVDMATGDIASLLKVVDTANIDLGETVAKLKGGAGNFPYSVAIVDCNDTVTIPVKEFPDSFRSLLYHGTQTSCAAEIAGNISTIVNMTGTSVVAATGLTATGTPTALGTLKEGIYMLKAISATKLRVIGYTDFDSLVMADETKGEVNPTTTDYTVSIGATVALTEIGVTVTAGASATAFTINDTAIFTVRRINAGYTNTPITDQFKQKYYKAYLFFQETPEGDMDYIELYRVKVSRGAHSAAVKEYHSQEITLTVTKDPAHSGQPGNWHRTNG